MKAYVLIDKRPPRGGLDIGFDIRFHRDGEEEGFDEFLAY